MFLDGCREKKREAMRERMKKEGKGAVGKGGGSKTDRTNDSKKTIVEGGVVKKGKKEGGVEGGKVTKRKAVDVNRGETSGGNSDVGEEKCALKKKAKKSVEGDVGEEKGASKRKVKKGVKGKSV